MPSFARTASLAALSSDESETLLRLTTKLMQDGRRDRRPPPKSLADGPGPRRSVRGHG
jgi:hypothetical protein